MIARILCAQLLLQFHSSPSKTKKVFWLLSENLGLKICMWFGYNPQIMVCQISRKLNFEIFHIFDRGSTDDVLLLQIYSCVVWQSRDLQLSHDVVYAESLSLILPSI